MSPPSTRPQEGLAPEPDAWGERLPRRLGAGSALAVLVGSTIGSGIFASPAEVARNIESLPLFALAWVLGGLVAMCGALTLAELAAMFPRTGGLYVYIREAFGALPAFLFGWAELLILRPAAYGAIALVSAKYLWVVLEVPGDEILALSLSRTQLGAAALIAITGTINYRGVWLGAIVQNLSTLLKVGALLFIVVLGFVLVPGEIPAASAPKPEVTAQASVLAGFGLAMVSVLWAYDGWSDVGFVSGEVRDPKRALPRAFIFGTLIVVILYLLANTVYVRVVPLADLPGRTLIAADVTQALIGSAGARFVAAAVMVSTFGTLNGSFMTGPRVFFAMAEDGLFFRGIGRIHPRHHTPSAAIAFSMALGIVFVSVSSFGTLADQFVIGIWPFYALAVAAVIVLRRREPLRERPYRCVAYPWVPLAFLLATIFLLGNYMVGEPIKFFANLAVVAVGIPVFWLWRKQRS